MIEALAAFIDNMITLEVATHKYKHQQSINKGSTEHQLSVDRASTELQSSIN
jgi:hypothetical protein